MTSVSVLIIDDDPAWSELLGRSLSRAGYDVAYAENGFDGLAAARRRRPDLILCDVGMQRGNGYQVVAKCRAAPDLRRIAIVACTGSGLLETATMALAVGFDGVLPKGTPEDELLRRVAGFIKGGS